MIVKSRYVKTSERGVYFRKLPIIEDGVNERGEVQKVSLRAVVLPKTYVEPTEDEVLEHLLCTNDELVGESHLVKVLKSLPSLIRLALRDRNEDYLKFIRENIPFSNLEREGRTDRYLFVSYGLLCDKFIKEARSKGEIDLEWYTGAFSDLSLRKRGRGGRWDIKILLGEDGLPKRDEMDILLKHEVDISRTFCCVGFYNTEQLNEVIDFIYYKFSKPTSFVILPDMREEVLEQGAFIGASALYKQVKEEALKIAQKERGFKKRGRRDIPPN